MSVPEGENKVSPGRDVVKISAAYKACRGIGNKKPTLAMPERVVILHQRLIYQAESEKGRTCTSI